MKKSRKTALIVTQNGEGHQNDLDGQENTGFVRSLANTLLESGGYTTVFHTSPKKALELINSNQIPDVEMLCMDGACNTQTKIMSILVSKGSKVAFIPPHPNVPLETFQRFLAAAGC